MFVNEAAIAVPELYPLYPKAPIRTSIVILRRHVKMARMNIIWKRGLEKVYYRYIPIPTMQL